MERIRFKVNGIQWSSKSIHKRRRSGSCESNVGLTGAKFGCGMACTVHVNGVRSCATPIHNESRSALLASMDKI